MNEQKDDTTKSSATDEMLEKTRQQAKEAFKITQRQTEEAARQLGSFLKIGARRLKKAADAAADAIRDDINKRPDG